MHLRPRRGLSIASFRIHVPAIGAPGGPGKALAGRLFSPALRPDGPIRTWGGSYSSSEALVPQGMGTVLESCGGWNSALARIAVAADSDNDGILDSVEIANGTSRDANANVIPDECEIGTTVTVPDDFPTIRDALNAAVTGWIIRLQPGTYVGTIDFGGRGLAIESIDGPLATILEGSGLGGSVFKAGPFGSFPAGTIPGIEGFTIRGCTGSLIPGTGLVGGGGMQLVDAGVLRIRDCIVTRNSAPRGAGVAVKGGSPEFIDCIIEGNSATVDAGGMLLLDSAARLVDTAVRNNVAGDRGGALLVAGGSPNLSSTLIRINAATKGGGVAVASGKGLSIAGSWMNDNNATLGGGLWIAKGVRNVSIGLT